MNKKGTLPYLINRLEESMSKSNVTSDHLWYAIRNALNPKSLIENLAEVMRISATETERLLIESGFKYEVEQNKLTKTKDFVSSDSQSYYTIASVEAPSRPFQDIFSIKFSPPLHQPIKLASTLHEVIPSLIETIIQSFKDDPFLALYRKDVLGYYHKFMATDAKKIDHYLANQFKEGYPRYILNSGMGANEQFNHFISQINNLDPDRRTTWFIVDSPRHLSKLPSDASVENTLFMEFSRSGKTEETVKIHEYTPREAKRIVFANSGPLRDLGIRDKNLVLEFPDQVAGRFGRNKTPILLAPMYVAGMDTSGFWRKIDSAIAEFDMSSPTSLPIQIAQFIYIHQLKNSVNHIYLGCNDDLLAYSAEELIQFWNEGVNKDGNDIGMSNYFGLLRDSHANIEGLLANHKTKMAIFLLREKISLSQLPPMTSKEIDPINKSHVGLCYGDEEMILAEANYQRFSELMPTIKITVHGDLTLEHAAVLGQLWADVTFCYSKMVKVDPGSNPEVKYVRDRSAKLLAEAVLRKG